MSAPMTASEISTGSPASPPGEPTATHRPTGWRNLLSHLPNLIVFSMLGMVMYLGHLTDWKLPKLSVLRGQTSVAVDDWCAEHLVPESQCIECRLELLPKSEPFGFCQKHGVNECVIDHPELSQAKGDPQLPKYDTVRAIELVSRPENNSLNTLHTHRVQFASAESVDKAGIDVGVVEERAMTDAIVANGELTFDPTHVAHLGTRVPGTVAFVFKALGDEVNPTDVLALVDAAQVGQAKNKLVESLVQHGLKRSTMERLETVSSSGAVARKALIEAEASLKEASIAVLTAKQALANLGFQVPDQFSSAEPDVIAKELRFLGIPKSFVDALPAGESTANLIPVRAPFRGMIVESDIVLGEVIDSTKNLITVADPARLWLTLNVRQEDGKNVHAGLPVRFQPDDGGAEIAGTVSWISPTVDAQTRTLQVRVPVSNSSGSLRDHTFGSGRIILREEPNAIVVPKESIQATSDAQFVFVRDKNYFTEGAPKFFHVRQVRPGAKDSQHVELLAGVLPGEVVATKGSAVLLAQLLRSNLGAGCGCHQH